MIEVFRTNVNNKSEAKNVMNELVKTIPDSIVSFDLEDCDRVLRVESRKQRFDKRQVMEMVRKNGFLCQVLNDEIK